MIYAVTSFHVDEIKYHVVYVWLFFLTQQFWDSFMLLHVSKISSFIPE